MGFERLYRTGMYAYCSITETSCGVGYYQLTNPFRHLGGLAATYDDLVRAAPLSVTLPSPNPSP